MANMPHFRSTGKGKGEGRHKHMTTMDVTVLLLLVATATVFLLSPTTGVVETKPKLVTITNNHTNYLSVRCFSFDNKYEVVHLKPWAQFRFNVTKRSFYPSATMFNCSTNIGTFVAFKFNYECSNDKYDTCDWRFDEESAYRWDPKSKRWTPQDYQPNYESLRRGGVIEGYYAN